LGDSVPGSWLTLEIRLFAVVTFWGPRTILFWLDRDGVDPLAGRTSVERCLIRHGLVTPQARKHRGSSHGGVVWAEMRAYKESRVMR
jgi:hypothetical protein